MLWFLVAALVVDVALAVALVVAVGRVREAQQVADRLRRLYAGRARRRVRR